MKIINGRGVPSKGCVLVITIIAALLLDLKMSSYLICLNCLYDGVKYFLLLILFFFFYYILKKTIENSILISFVTWIALDCLSFYLIYSCSQRNGSITITCPVSSYINIRGKSDPYLVYYYKGTKQFLHYHNHQLDSLQRVGNDNPKEKIELKLNLSVFCSSIYYRNDFEVIVNGGKVESQEPLGRFHDTP